MPGWWSTPHPNPADVIPTNVNLPFSSKYKPPPLSPTNQSKIKGVKSKAKKCWNGTAFYYLNRHLAFHLNIQRKTSLHTIQRKCSSFYAIWCIQWQLRIQRAIKINIICISFSIKHLVGFILIMGTEAVCRIAVPVCPEERSDEVLPHPAILPWNWLQLKKKYIKMLYVYVFVSKTVINEMYQ